MHPGVDEVLEGFTVLGPMLYLIDRALDLAARHRNRTAHLGDEHSSQSVLVALQRVMQLRQAVVAELQVARPVRLIERAPRCSNCPRHVVDRSVGSLPGHLLTGRVDDVECGSAGGVLKFAIDKHPLVAGQHPRVSLHVCHWKPLLCPAPCSPS